MLKTAKMMISIIVQCFSYFARECLSTASGLLVEKNMATKSHDRNQSSNYENILKETNAKSQLSGI